MEYALKSLENASTIIAAKFKDGIIMGTEKVVLSKLAVEGNDQRVYTVDPKTGVMINGLIPDGRNVVQRAREEAAGYLDFTGVPISGNVILLSRYYQKGYRFICTRTPSIGCTGHLGVV